MIKREKEVWESGRVRTITFIVTKDCQLACKYCYLVAKNKNERMNFKVAQKAVDYILSERKIFNEPSVAFEFIGGEPFLEIELIDKISDYIKKELYVKEHPWFNSYRFGFTTNGLLYNDTKVQQYIEKNKSHISITITIDGIQKKHDIQRVYANGKGSYNDVVKNIPLWVKQFEESSTKVTVSSDDIPYIKESVLHLWRLEIPNVYINAVYESIWKEEDDLILEKQLIELAVECRRRNHFAVRRTGGQNDIRLI